MSYWMLLAAQLVMAPSAITPDQIGVLAPDDLGRRLLGPTRQPIVEAFLYGVALEPPPPPPGAPVATRIVLYERAHESGEPGFCEKIRYFVRLRPVVRSQDGKLPPASVDLVTPTTLYRLRTSDGSGPVCEGRGHDFISVDDQNAELVFSLIRQLAATQDDMRHNKPLEIAGSVDDEYGRQSYPVAGLSGPILDWRIAFLHFPTTKISRFARTESADGLTVSFRAAEWTIELTIPSGHAGIGKVALRRFIPSPA